MILFFLWFCQAHELQKILNPNYKQTVVRGGIPHTVWVYEGKGEMFILSIQTQSENVFECVHVFLTCLNPGTI